MKEKFTWWYERVFLQSPSLCQLEYDDEKMWEAWQAGYKVGRDNVLDAPILTEENFDNKDKEEL
jgi:hypothetical protein